MGDNGRKRRRELEDETQRYGYSSRGRSSMRAKDMSPGFDGKWNHSSDVRYTGSRNRDMERGYRGREKSYRSRSRDRDRSHGNVWVGGETRSGSSPFHDRNICRDFASGMCRRGTNCRFYHPPDHIEGGRSVKVSRYHESDGYDDVVDDIEPVRSSHHRRFSHAITTSTNDRDNRDNRDKNRDNRDRGLRHTSIERRSGKPLCRYFLAGNCQRENCRFSHDELNKRRSNDRPRELSDVQTRNDKELWNPHTEDDGVDNRGAWGSPVRSVSRSKKGRDSPNRMNTSTNKWEDTTLDDDFVDNRGAWGTPVRSSSRSKKEGRGSPNRMNTSDNKWEDTTLDDDFVDNRGAWGTPVRSGSRVKKGGRGSPNRMNTSTNKWEDTTLEDSFVDNQGAWGTPLRDGSRGKKGGWGSSPEKDTNRNRSTTIERGWGSPEKDNRSTAIRGWGSPENNNNNTTHMNRSAAIGRGRGSSEQDTHLNRVAEDNWKDPEDVVDHTVNRGWGIPETEYSHNMNRSTSVGGVWGSSDQANNSTHMNRVAEDKWKDPEDEVNHSVNRGWGIPEKDNTYIDRSTSIVKGWGSSEQDNNNHSTHLNRSADEKWKDPEDEVDNTLNRGWGLPEDNVKLTLKRDNKWESPENVKSVEVEDEDIEPPGFGKIYKYQKGPAEENIELQGFSVENETVTSYPDTATTVLPPPPPLQNNMMQYACDNAHLVPVTVPVPVPVPVPASDIIDLTGGDSGIEEIHEEVPDPKLNLKTEDTKLEVDEDGDTKEVEGQKKDDKHMRTFKCELIILVKQILKPTWSSGVLTREAHKTIVKKVVEKVTRAIKVEHIPRSLEKTDQYLANSREKIRKLALAYVERSKKL